MEAVAKKMELKDLLENKKIKVVPIKRGSEWLPVGHDGEFLFTDAAWSTDLPVNHNTGSREVIFTKEETEVMEKELNLPVGDMNFYDKDKGFWAYNKKARVMLSKEERVLDLNNIIDVIHYRILKKSKFIAPSWKDRFQSGAFKFALVDEEETTKDSNTKYNLMKDVYLNFGKMESSARKMQNVLKLYGKKTSNNDLDFLKGEIQKLIDKNAQEFVNIVTDKDFNTKVMIEEALAVRAIERNSSKQYILAGGDLIGRSLQEAIEWLDNPTNSDIVLKLEAQIKNAN